MKRVSIAERKQFRICKMQKHKITKMQKGAKSIFLIDKENAYILQRKRRWQTENRAVHCAQMCRKYTPKGKMGHPKRRNGIPQMVKWDIIKGGLGASRHG
jgi:hypothetical protein